jgi:hypothetical protein
MDNGDGTYAAHYVQTLAGPSTLVMVLGAVPIHNGELRVMVDAGAWQLCCELFFLACSSSDPSHAPAADASAATSLVSGAGLRRAVVGVPATIAVTPRDEFLNRASVTPADCSVVLTGPATVTAALTVRDDGSLVATYTATAAGRYAAAVLLRGVPVAGAPFVVVVEPSTC